MAIRKKTDEISMHNQAHYDHLTGLTNKGMFNDRLEIAIHQAERNEEVIAVLFLDIDDFKNINDTYGHSFGDELLQQIGILLKESVRKGDTVSRWGGDEFAIILPSIKNISGIDNLCNRILYNKLNHITVSNKKLSITASIGISLYPNNSKNLKKIIDYADRAMYKAKNSGKNNFCYFK